VTHIVDGTSSDPTFKYFSYLKKVVGGAVTSVGEYAFFSSSLEEVILPAAVTIGQNAFDACTSLGLPGPVRFPAVTDIDDYAFYGCTSLSSVIFPAAIKIGEAAFSGCTGLVSVDLSRVDTIGEAAFEGCSSLGRDLPDPVIFPSAVTIGDGAFWKCDRLSSISLPAATTIGQLAFDSCTSLISVEIPRAASIGGRAFQETGTTTSLTVILGAAVPTLGTEMFFDVPDPDKSETGTKQVTVEVPAGALEDYGSPFDKDDTTADNWGNGFRGGGWDGDAMTATAINPAIELAIIEAGL
jgi:hypothetical protein